MMKTKILLPILLLIGIHATSNANNVQTANVVLTGQNTAANHTQIKFDISWDNSWRTSTNESNYDGVWIFCKFRKKNTSAWQHASINYVSPGDAISCGHTAPAGSIIQTGADGKGVWMYRDADGQGTVNWTDAQLQWNYGADNVLDADSVEVRLFACEMVNIPEGKFYLGSGGTEDHRFRRGTVDSFYEVTSENAITIGVGATNLTSSTASTLVNGTLPAAYPKGFTSFWIMKYEASQQQYADFLNTMDLAGATARNAGTFTGTHPNFVAPNPERAYGGTSSEDLLAYADWAALRPFTELEYEKACRGSNILPVVNEYAWGSTTIAQVATPTAVGTTNESWSSGNCNYYNALYGSSLRCGALATATSNRVQSGATYYGVMEMSGNLFERVITANTVGRTFTGTNGDGNLNNTYDFNTAGWNASAMSFKGASFNTNTLPNTLRVSDRGEANSFSTGRFPNYGLRVARSAE
jgi:formylglycine-generating enzyme required for sulfatase activity